MIRTFTLAGGTILGSLSCLLLSQPAYATDDINPSELLNLSLEQLSNIEVTSVSKKSEKANEAAAAIYVITPDDIRRSGATSVPEVLRIVPGLDVAQSGANQWAITSRGSNNQFANKMLVLIDGRSVYTPLFSGVFWDVQDVVMEDIERIEVIRGPGATLWGANAVNGVINIITKTAQDTQGGLASVTVGSYDRSLNTVRYGAKIAEDAYVRTYAKYDDYNQDKTLTGSKAYDQWNKAQGGFRSDWKEGANQSFTLQGDIYRAGEDYPFNLPRSGAPFLQSVVTREIDTGANVLGRWDDKISKDSDVTLQMYYDYARRNNFIYTNDLQTFDVDIQHVWLPFSGHEIVWGGGYRLIKDSSVATPYIQFTPASRTDNLFSSFVQDKITLVSDKLFLTLGSKFEHNDYTGFEMQPSARLAWLVDDKQTVWSSVSRAVRTPNISDADVQIVATTLAPGVIGARVGSKATQAEELIAYELGYRINPAKNISLDVASFYNDYNRLVLGVPGGISGPFTTAIGNNYVIASILPINAGTAHSWGVETSAKWNPTPILELAAGYTLLEIKFDQADPFGFSFAGKAPQQQFNLRSSVKLPHDVEFDTTLYYVDPLTSLIVDNYTRLDMKLSWKAIPGLELSLVGQNLIDSAHQEFTGFLYQSSSQIPRSVYGNVTWKF